jgi:hypothetical protein
MIAELFREQKPLMVAGLIFFAGFIFLTVLMLFDSTQVLGINRWIKPIKFFISVAIFLWTVAVYLRYLKGRDKLSAALSWGLYSSLP